MLRSDDPLGATLPALKRCALFAQCLDSDLARVVPLLVERVVPAGAVVVAEGDAATELFVIRNGRVEVTKRAPDAARAHRLTTLGPGASFGELTFVDRGPRSASVRALEPTTLAALPIAALDALTAGDVAMRGRMLAGLSAFLASRLRGVSEVTASALEHELELAETRIRMGTFLTYVVFIMVGYGFATRFIADLAHTAADTTIITIPVLLGFGIPLYFMMRQSGEPIATYGLTWNGAAAAAGDAVLWSVPIMLGALALKAAVVHLRPDLADAPIFALGGFRDPTVTPAAARFALAMSLAYMLLVPLQEFIARGALQSPLQRFLVGPHASAMAVVVANALFVAAHLYLSIGFALIAMIPGFLWGWLYARHGTLLAPVVSHVLVGWWAFFVLGFDRLLV